MLDDDKENNATYPLKQLVKDIFESLLNFVKICFKWIKSNLVLLGLLVAIILPLSLYYVDYLRQNKEKEISRIPYFSYSFSKEINKFIVTSGENFYVKKVNWYMPETQGDYPVGIAGDHSVFLDPVYIKRRLVWDFQAFNKESLSNNRVKEIMRCSIIPSISEEGLPLVAQVVYTYKGDTVSTSTIDLLRLKRFDTGLPFLDPIKRNISKEIGLEFISYGQNILKMIFPSDTKNYPKLTPAGDCGVILDGIHPIDWTDF